MVRRTRRRTVLASGAAGAASLAGCFGILDGGGGPPGQGGNSGDTGFTARIGVLAPQSGSLGTFGPEITDGTELVKRQVDVSPNDFSVELGIRDTASDPDTAVSAAEELVSEGYQAIVGPGSGEAVEAVVNEVAVPEQVVTISPLAATGLSELDDDDLAFATAPRAAGQGVAISRPIARARTESASIVFSENDYGRGLGTRIGEEIETRGIDVPARVGIEDLEASSYVSVLEEAMADNPGSLIVATDPVTGIQVLSDFYAEFETRPVFLTDRLRLPSLPSEVDSEMPDARVISLRPNWRRGRGSGGDDGTETNGTDGDGQDGEPTATGEDAELLTEFLPAFRTAYERVPTIQAAQGFDAAATLVLATIRIGEDDYDGAEIKGAVRAVTNTQDQYTGVLAFDSGRYWEGLSEIADGVRNNFTGAASDVQLDPGTGQLVSPTLQSSRFAPDSELGLEETLPIPTG